MDGFRAAFSRTRERLDSYTLELHKHGLESVEREVRWLSELIDDERRRESPASPRADPPDAWGRPARPAPRQTPRSNHEGAPHGFGTRGHRRRRQLRRVAGPGRRVLQGRRPAEPGARSHARPVRRLPRPRRGVRRGVRRRRQEGRPGPQRRHHGQREQHHQDLRRAADRRHRAARPHPRRPRQVLPRDHHRVRRGAGRRRHRPARRAGRRARLLPAGRVRGRREVLRAVRDRRRRRLRQRAARSSSPAPPSGRRSSRTPACRSSATTSSRRSAPPSRTACWPSCSRTAA